MTRGMRAASAPGAALLLAALAGAQVPRAVAAETRPASAQAQVLARSFEVRYRALSDAADVVGAVLSPDGTVTLRPNQRTLVVQDRVEVLDRVAALLQSFDLPPRNVEVTLSLLLGTDRRAQEAGREAAPSTLTREVRGVTETLGDFTKWTSYEILGSRSVTGAEGAQVDARLSDDYRVRLEIESYDPANEIVKLRRLTLQRIKVGPGGTERYEDLYTVGVVVKAGQMRTVGAAKSPDSNRALFLTLQARPR